LQWGLWFLAAAVSGSVAPAVCAVCTAAVTIGFRIWLCCGVWFFLFAVVVGCWVLEVDSGGGGLFLFADLLLLFLCAPPEVVWFVFSSPTPVVSFAGGIFSGFGVWICSWSSFGLLAALVWVEA
jgi:hypothetical protein